MDVELENQSHGANFIPARTRSSRRFKYEAEVQVIKQQIGDLEAIRTKLGLSQRKMCELLLVDPSAWTRWLKTDAVPPHVYRALSWYISHTEKSPLDHSGNYEKLKAQIQTLFIELSGAQRKLQEFKTKYIMSLYVLAGFTFVGVVLAALN